MFESNKHSNFNSNSHHKSAPTTTRLLLAQLINSFIEYTSELTYFSINTFQTSSLKRIQTATLTRFNNYSIPRLCVFHYSLDREFEEFIQRMKKLCKRTQNTFLDIRSARIHYPQSSMDNIQDTHRALNILKCNIERLRDLKQIHQDVGYDLLLPNDQLFLSLDLLVTNFQLILCELDNRVRFKDAIILQTFVKDIFLQFRVILTWLYPAVKMAAYQMGNSDQNLHVQHRENVSPSINKTSKAKELHKKQDFLINPISTIKVTQDRSQSALNNDQDIEQKQSEKTPSSIIINQYINKEKEFIDNNRNQNMDRPKQSSISASASYSSTLSFTKRPSISNRDNETAEQGLLINNHQLQYKKTHPINSSLISSSMKRILDIHQLHVLDLIRLM